MNHRVNRAPGVGGFLKTSSMFARPGETVAPVERVVTAMWAEIRRGALRPGENFPVPARMARLTGESEATCAEAVSELLKSGVLKQTPVGSLFVTKVRPPAPQ